MNIFSILMLIGGLAFFLYGISLMSSGLEKIAGGKLEQILKKATSNPLKGFVLGTGITALIQSSSAVTVMLVGLVNSGIMNLSQTVSVIIGTNIGTTITAWILSLASIKGSYGFIIELLKPQSFTPIFALVGVIMIMVAKSNKRKNIGNVLMGFAILMFGMEIMANSMSPLADMPEFRQVLFYFSNPFLALLTGLFVTVIIQSSSASVGILQALTMIGGISYGVAIPIILGENLGACISAVLASIGVSTNAKRVAGVHVIFNIIGILIVFPIFLALSYVFKYTPLNMDISPVGVAIVHTLYNVIVAMILFPFQKWLENLAVKFIPDNKNSKTQVFLDERLLITPSIAISECYNKTVVMANTVQFNFTYSTKMLKSFHQKKADQILENEIKIDTYEDKLNLFLLKLAGKELTEEDNNRISQLLLAIGDYERIGDHTSHILKIAAKLNETKVKLSDVAIEELKVIVHAVSEIFDVSFEAYKTDNEQLAQTVEPLEAVIKKLIRKVKNNHIQRLKDGDCTMETGFMFNDLLNDLRRIAAHCGNIAMSVIQLKDSSISKHEYNHRNKDEDEDFISKYQDYKSKFSVSKLKEIPKC